VISILSLSVKAGIVPAIHAPMKRTTAWRPGTSLGMTVVLHRAASLGDVPYGA
jgi:hypothetical protein